MTLSAALTYGTGIGVGALLGPALGFVSALRSLGRDATPADVFRGRALLDPAARGADEVLGMRLEGEVLIRLSDASSCTTPCPVDLLYCDVRFGRGRPGIFGDQDLSFATARRPWALPLAPFLTEFSDYLANDYYALGPFRTWDHPAAYFRIHPELFDGTPSRDGTLPTREARRQRVIRKAGAGDLRLELEVTTRPFGPFRPLLRIEVEEALPRDPPELVFDVANAGAGIDAVGFSEAVRKSVRFASRFTRHIFGGANGAELLERPPRELRLFA